MGPAVGDVVELVGPDRAAGVNRGELLRQAPGIAHVVVRIAVGLGRHFDQRGAGQPDHVLLFLALGLGDHDHRAKPHRRADQRQPDPGVAGGALDDGAAGPERAARHRVADDPECGAILYRLAGVHELGLAPDLAAGGLGRASEPYQRRVPHRRRKIRCHDHRFLLAAAGSGRSSGFPRSRQARPPGPADADRIPRPARAPVSRVALPGKRCHVPA